MIFRRLKSYMRLHKGAEGVVVVVIVVVDIDVVVAMDVVVGIGFVVMTGHAVVQNSCGHIEVG